MNELIDIVYSLESIDREHLTLTQRVALDKAGKLIKLIDGHQTSIQAEAKDFYWETR